MKILWWFHERKQHSQLAISPSAVGKTDVCKENRKITMKKCGPKHISIPNENVWGGSFKRRMRKEKNISKQKTKVKWCLLFILL